MKIDFHVHLTPPDIAANWKKYAEKEPYFSLLSRGKVNKFAGAQDVVSMLDKEGFDRAVVFGFAFSDAGLCRYVNDYVIESVKKSRGRLTGFAVVSPRSLSGGKNAAAEIERCHDAGLKGVGELYPLPSAGFLRQRHGIDLEDKKQTQAITGVCKERGIPLMLHAGEPVGHSYPGKSSAALRQLESFISDNSGVKIVLAHWGGGIFLYETMKEIKEAFRDVYYDISATPFLYDERIFQAAKALGLCGKILFGSDFPILPPSRYLAAIEKCGFTESDKELLFGGNAERAADFSIK